MRHDPVPPPRFLVDAMLGHVARDLRLLGLEARFAGRLGDAEVLGWAQRQGLRLLTRDAGLARRAGSLPHLWVRSADREEQVREVLRSLPRELEPAPLSRCLGCGGVLGRVPREEAAPLVPDHVALSSPEFWRCRECRRVFWRGSHAPGLERRARELAAYLLSAGHPGGRIAPPQP